MIMLVFMYMIIFWLYLCPDIRPETLKQLQEVVGNTLEHVGIGNDSLSRTQKAQHLREIMNNETASN
jgi:hypothetical protein